MIPLHFGDSAAPLYGVLHPSTRGGKTPVAAVICPPLGHEYLQAHRVVRNLAAELASRGIGTLRFDFSGTGDSSGDGADLTITRMTADVREAITEVKGATGARRVALVALRGGAFAALSAAQDPSVVGCVLWEPVLNGRTVLTMLDASRGGGPNGTVSFGGFDYGPTFRDELARFDSDALWSSPAVKLRVVAARDEGFSALRARTDDSSWVNSGEPFDFGPPGSQDLLHITETRLMQVAVAVEQLLTL